MLSCKHVRWNANLLDPVFLFYYNIFIPHSQHSHAYSHRKRGQGGSEGPDTPADSLMVHARSVRQLIFRVCIHSQKYWSTLISEAKTDGGSEFLFWYCEWAQTRVWREGTIVVTHAAKSITQEVLPCPSLWDTLQGEETDNGHRVSQGLHGRKKPLRMQQLQVSPAQIAVNSQRKTAWTIRDSLGSVKSLIHKWICANTGYVPIRYYSLSYISYCFQFSFSREIINTETSDVTIPGQNLHVNRREIGTDVNAASIFYTFRWHEHHIHRTERTEN